MGIPAGLIRTPSGEVQANFSESLHSIRKRKMQSLSAMLHASVSEADVAAIMRAMIERAMKGNIKAAAFVLDRTIGKASDAEIKAQLDDLEEIVLRLRADASNQQQKSA